MFFALLIHCFGLPGELEDHAHHVVDGPVLYYHTGKVFPIQIHDRDLIFPINREFSLKGEGIGRNIFEFGHDTR